MTDERRPEGGARTTSRRVNPNSQTRRTYPRCGACGALAPTPELLARHQERDCHGLVGLQLSIDDELDAQGGFATWDVFR